MAGIDVMRGLLEGRLPAPPAIGLIGITLTEVAPGRVVMRLTPGPQHANPMGTMHGGMLATLLDSVMGSRYTPRSRPEAATAHSKSR